MHHAYCVNTLLYKDVRGIRVSTDSLSHIILVLFIPLEFPTLLAKREIIANASVLPTKIWNGSTLCATKPRAKLVIISESGKIYNKNLYLCGQLNILRYG